MQYVQPTSDRGELVTIADLEVDLRVGADMGRRGSKRGSIRGSFSPDSFFPALQVGEAFLDSGFGGPSDLYVIEAEVAFHGFDV